MIWLIDGLIDWSMGWLSDGLIDWWSEWLFGWFTGAGGAGGDSSAEVKELKAALDKAEADRAKVSNRTLKASNIWNFSALQSSGDHNVFFPGECPQ